MSDTPKFEVLLGGSKPKNKADALIERAEAELEDFKKYATFDARRKKVQYDAYIAAGFTAEQALYLTK